ncbi:hypothetical protein Q9R46_19730 [Paenibacillus sp. RRE4]|uniref:hypothetical protein n=1 Tax=Paenibacillus sp. RRE4 TaxID=2962587 RepID=UPI002881BD19|nr:hypothetical protein [Paenibacillus sp. RRE4]MDT0124905.1 hypothetical protein [Paenibacillus sp. RRE4]
MINRKFKLWSMIVIGGALITSLSWLALSDSNVEAEIVHTTQKNGYETAPKEKIIHTDALYLGFDNVEELDRNADLIIIGSTAEEFQDRKHITTTFDDGVIQDFYTLTNLNIDSVIKKPDDSDISTGQTLEAIEPIGYTDPAIKDTKITLNDYTELEKDITYIMFLEKNDQGNYVLINLNLGKFNLEEPEITTNAMRSLNNSSENTDQKYNEFWESVKEKYNLNIEDTQL